MKPWLSLLLSALISFSLLKHPSTHSYSLITMSEALSTGQKVFNQRLLAEHCLSEAEAIALYEDVQKNYQDLKESFTQSLQSANAQLQYLGLEIVAISIPNPKGNKPERHYAMVNKFPDDIAKQAFQATIFQPASQQAYVKAVLEKLVQDGASARATLLNLKNDIKEKIPLSSAEDALERLLEEKWLVETGERRGSNGAEIILGPRTYCELSYLLTEEFGMDKDDLPQQIYHRM
jgi:Nse1 non-SMC component of SMC5-6 complex